MLPFASFPRHTALIIIAQIEATADQPHQAKAHPRSDQEPHDPTIHVTCLSVGTCVHYPGNLAESRVPCFSDHFLGVQIMCYLSM